MTLACSRWYFATSARSFSGSSPAPIACEASDAAFAAIDEGGRGVFEQDEGPGFPLG